MKRETFKLKLAHAEMLAPGVRHLAFTREDGNPLVFIPGQFITVHIPTEQGEVRRSYSIASIGRQDLIEIAVSYVEGGIATRLFSELRTGEIIEASGPFGRLILRDETPKRYLLIATGTGITPYRAMLPDLAKLTLAHHTQVCIIFGTRTSQEVLYRDDFLQYMEQYPQIQYHTCYSRAPATLAYEHPGYVQNVLKALQPDAAGDIVYLCGNPNMIDDIYAELQALGFETAQVRREKYVSSK